MGERGDIVRRMQRALGGMQRDLTVLSSIAGSRVVIGRIAGKGLADELRDEGYLVVDSIDGRAHYLPLRPGADLREFPLGAIVEARNAAAIRAADKGILDVASDGLYRTDKHVSIAVAQTTNRDPHAFVAAHVRRLEALRRAGIVERLADGVWRVPADLPERGRQYDAGQLRGAAIELRSHLPIERQTRAIGVTWLDRQLLTPVGGLSENGFGGDVHTALRERTEFLIGEGLAERRGQRVVLARNLLATLRNREIETVGKVIAAETGLAHQVQTDGQRVTGIYRRTVLLVSGRFAMLDNGMGFSLVPWRPVIEQKLGHTITAIVRGGGVSWEFGRQRGPGAT